MRASGHQPAARRADLSASKPSSNITATPRRAATPVREPGSAFLKRAAKSTAGLAAGAALIGGMVTVTAQPAAASTLDNAPRLHKGMRGSAVVRLQRELSGWGAYVPDTGYYGSITKKRVNRLKAKHGWKTDGVAGRKVWKLLLSDDARISSPSLGGSSGGSGSGSSKGVRALEYAKKQLGDPYSYGADGPGSFDCSGLTMAAYRSVGVHLSHNTVSQYNQIKHVSKSNLRLGDLVFFYSGRSHVGIYAGNGKVIHAGRPGEPVEYIKMKYMPYNGAGRPA